MHTKAVRAYFLISCAALGVLFYFHPLDIYISRIFFDSKLGFVYKHQFIFAFLHDAIYGVMVVLAGSRGVVMLDRWWVIRSFDYRYYLKPIYVLLACIIGPGLIVNMGFKEHFHRPRPSQTIIFNGQKDYAPPFSLKGQCEHNCSFVSGHASVGFAFYALAFIQTNIRKRKRYTILATVLGLSFGLVRIVQGSHYLSDVIFSGIVVYISCYLLAKILKPENEIISPSLR